MQPIQKFLSRIAFALSICTLSACASTPAAPFDTMEHARVTAYRLHPVPAPTAAANQTGSAPVIPGLPPEVMQWAQQAGPALQKILPPGMIPPALLPEAQQQQAHPQAPLFQGFPVVQSVPVIDEDLKEDLAQVLGEKDSFRAKQFDCMYAEFGISISGAPNAPANDVLISLACNRVQAQGFMWPHGQTGLSQDGIERLSRTLPELFPASAPMQPAQLGLPAQPTQPVSSNSEARLLISL